MSAQCITGLEGRSLFVALYFWLRVCEKEREK
jgi:hypothetical protein